MMIHTKSDERATGLAETASGRGGTGRADHAGRAWAVAVRKATRQAARTHINPTQLHSNKADKGYCVEGHPDLVLPWATGEELVVKPQHAANFALPSWQRTQRRQCAIVVDRHVHKNGGSTMRDIFLENERLGYGLYHGYMQLYWRYDLPLLRSIAEQAVASGRAPSHFLMIEAHFGYEEFSQRVMSDLLELRALYQEKKVDCPIVLVTRVREPLAYYLSFYKWGVAYRQKEAPAKGNGMPSWGRNFTEWVARVPNLQSSVMVHSMAAASAEYQGRLFGGRGGNAWANLDKMLSAFDVVGTTDKFDETLLLTADLSGLPVLTYKYNKPQQKGGFKGTTATVCPDMELCRDVVRRSAPLDHQMWNKYSAAFDVRLKAMGLEFEERVSHFKAHVAASQKVWRTAPRAQTICRYHQETPHTVPVLRPENLRCPVDDSVALCQRWYAHRLFECPWQYAPNSTLTDVLGCWRPRSGFLR